MPSPQEPLRIAIGSHPIGVPPRMLSRHEGATRMATGIEFEKRGSHRGREEEWG